MSRLAFDLPPGLEAGAPPEARGLTRDAVRMMVAHRDGRPLRHSTFALLPAALAGLTVRGRAFLAAGVAVAACAVVLGQRDLLRVAVLLVAVPVLSVLFVARSTSARSSARVS